VQPDRSSGVPSQSSSLPLQVSAGGLQAPQLHVEVHVLVPVLPQLVVQEPLVPLQHENPSSHVPSQSSSTPLHVSPGGVHDPQLQELEHTLDPVVPQLDVQEPEDPLQQVKPLSHVPSQSSSAPLQVSAGGLQAPHTHDELHVLVPVLPQEVVQLPVVPLQQAMPGPSSHVPLQSSSTPLHVSSGGTQLLQVHVAEQIMLPVVPHDEVQVLDSPRQQS